MQPTIDLGERPRILLVRLSAIGDVVVATPVIRALRATFPSAYLAWLVDEKAADIVRGNPALDEVIVARRPRVLSAPGSRSVPAAWSAAGSAWSLIGALRRRRFDVAIDFQGLLRSALLARLSGARWRIASAGTREGSACFYNVRVPRTEEPSSRQRCLDLLKPLGICSRDRRMWVWFDSADQERAERLVKRVGGRHPALPSAAPPLGEKAATVRGDGRRSPVVCLCPATTWRHKHWREERWARVGDALARDGATPIFLGGGKDRPMLERISSSMRYPAYVAAGETTLKEAAALLARAGLAIAVDTSLMHIAVAVGTPTVALCGPSYWPGFQDYEDDGRFSLLRKPYPCSPCLRHPTCRNDDCMTDLAVAEVLVEARRLLGAGAPRTPG